MRRHFQALASESAVYGLSGLTAAALGFVVVPVYTRAFSPGQYGVLSVVTATTALVATLSVLALDAAAHRWFLTTEDVADRQTTFATWMWTQLATSAALVALGSALAGPLVVLLGLPDGTDDLLRLALLAVPLSTASTVALNWYRVRRLPWRAVAVGGGLAVAGAGCSLLLVGLGHGLVGYFAGQVLAQVAVAASCVLALRGGWLSPRRASRARLRAMARYSLPLVPAALGTWVVMLLDRALVKAFAGSEEAGLYALGCTLGALVALVTTAFQLAWGPFALSLAETERDAPDVLARALVLYTWVVGLLAAAVTVLAPAALSVVAPPSYAGAASVVGPIAFSYLVIGLVYIAATGPTLAGTTSPVAVGTGLAALSTVVLDLALIPRWGRDGAAWATVLSWAIVPVWVFWRGQRVHPLPFPFRRAAGIGGVLAATALALRLLVPDPGAAGLWACAAVVALVGVATAPWALLATPTGAGRRR